MSADPSTNKTATRSASESHTRVAMGSASLPWADLTEALQLNVGVQLRGIVEILLAVHAKYQLGRPLVSSRAAWVLSIKRGAINRDGEAELHSQPPPPPDASDDPWRSLVAPEVQKGARPDERSDIFVLGGMLFEALTGNRFETPESAVKELEKSRTTARAAGLGGDYWEVELLAAAVRATREDPESRWTDAKQFADEIVRIAGKRIKSKSALGAIVAGQSQPPEAPDSRKVTARPAAAKDAPKLAAAAKPKDSTPMQPAPVPKRSFTPAGLGVVSPPTGPAPATGLGPPLPKGDPKKTEPAAPAQPAQEEPKLSATGRKGTMVGLGVEMPPPAGAESHTAASSGKAGDLRVSATGRKGTMVGLGVEMPAPPTGQGSEAGSQAQSRGPVLSATGRKGTMVGLGLDMPPAPSHAAPVGPNQAGRFGTIVGMGPKLPPPPPDASPSGALPTGALPTDALPTGASSTDASPADASPSGDLRPSAPVGPDQPGRHATVQGLGPDAEIPVPSAEETYSELSFDLTHRKPKRRLGKVLLVAAVVVVAPLLVLRFGFRAQYDALTGAETNAQGVEAEPVVAPVPKVTMKEEPQSPDTSAAEPSKDGAEEQSANDTETTETALEEGQESETSEPGSEAAPADESSADEATDDSADGDSSEAAEAPAPAPKPKPRYKPRRKPKKKELKTPDYGI